ncbi:SusD-like starch-binding protein associating with outer membrane [Gillisia mitskevichiae]|uniref:SusD-like starch-binding protein associating with outer membrane n=1 Tax=Gillisia mitskevichiae TaxID=270921 RepID=A0A495P852_9FLAO|nr:SusD/RagB family nutrient-binding outer membrane lipoprotein [Gillisia mitskevichiae]RKS44949.1 SusD-like starch-binding protein associating with outer membrane [Gillisia mitskevichiae]
MKKYILTIIALASLWSCQTDEQYEDYNLDPKNPAEVSADFLFTAATVSLGDQMASANVNRNIFRFVSQYWTSTTYLDEPNYDLNNRGITDSQWNELYRDVLFDLEDSRRLVEADVELTEGERTARLAQIEVLEVYTWQVLVDTFGDIPYTEALNADEFPQPKYDDAATIYSDLISRLTAVNPDFQAGSGFSDVIYGGDMTNWAKFSNSLLLRIGMRLSDVNEGLATSATTTAVANGVFMSNDDNATIVYQSTNPNTNPLWTDLVESGRSDYVPANTLVDVMNDLNDPRRSAYFDDNLAEYVGGVYGGSNSYPSYSHVGEVFLDATFPGLLLDYSEVEFHLAEAAQRGFGVTGTAEDHYNAAVTASINYWGGSDADATAYLAQADVAYDAANWRESIGNQFWIAMYDNSIMGWNVWRKFDTPVFNLPEDSGSFVPLRYTYPIGEQNLNLTNYEAASAAIGGDDQQTPIFWDTTTPDQSTYPGGGE